MSIIDTQDRWVHTDRGRLFTRCWYPAATDTQRAAIVLQHDSLGCVELWRDLPEQLAIATGRQVIAYDRLGFGRSAPYPGHIGKDWVQAEAHGDFQIVIEALGVEKFIAIGHSIGAGISIASAAIHAQSCVALITESSQVFVEPHIVEGIRVAKIEFEQPGQIERLQKYHADKATWVLNAWTETWLSPDFSDWTLDPYLRAVKCPVLGLHGDNDEFGTLKQLDRISELTGGTSVVMKGCGHIPHREQPEAVLTIIREWLQNIA